MRTAPDATHSLNSNRVRLYETGAVLGTALGKFVFLDYLQWRLGFVLVIIVAWTAYLLYRRQKTSGVLRHWGFRTDNLGVVLRRVLPFGLAAVAAFFIVGYVRGTVHLTWHVFPILVLYPL
ncbi:hypothetical protein SAMN05421823_11267 [Catalinimonas alkaloidigena]|uniref:Uncharacterized protein n=1 Tax=Catalinimonas alkaloidigena TaxID=1075417 RepID=A0A1G9S8D4_9BACT|nr:hypothetical protein [Catalinimonas alkaloidigena]SDM31714.1 hypothetical protein SAMN05421823_11267 [Catalinimonas alkaloidigena]